MIGYSAGVAPDGVYVEGAAEADAGALVFMALPAPSADEVPYDELVVEATGPRATSVPLHVGDLEVTLPIQVD